MSSRIRRPETTRIEISQGDYLIVKKHLTAGEERRIYTRLIKTLVAGERATLDPDQAGLSNMIEYLLDWSITDPDGKPVVVRDRSVGEVAAALLKLDPESFVEIRDAINAHDAQMTAEREAEKKLSAGVTTSSATSESPA